MSVGRRIRCWPRGLLLVSVLISAGATPGAAWRPIGSTEVASIEWLRQWCATGRPTLATDSWLSDLDRTAGDAEIEVRLGRPCENDWSLQTVDADRHPGLASWQISNDAGLEELVFLTFDEQGRLLDLWTVWESMPSAALAAGLQWTPASGLERRSRPPTQWPLQRVFKTFRWSGLLVCFGIAVLLLARPGRITRAAPALLVLAVLAPSCGPVQAPTGFSESVEPTSPRLLGSYIDLRRALWSGRATAVGAEQLEHPVLRQWLADRAIRAGDFSSGREHLDAIPPGSPSTAGTLLLRATLHVDNDNPIAAQRAVLAAVDALPAVDTLLVEGGILLDLVGRTESATRLLDRAVTLGSRNPDLPYQQLRHRLVRGDLEHARRLLTEAYRLRPTARASLLSDPVRAYFLRPGNEVWSLLDPTRHQAPHVTPSREPEPVATLDPARPNEVHERSGDTLRIRWPNGSLWVAGGALLTDAEPVAGDQWDRESLSRALAALPDITSTPSSSGPAEPTRLLRRAVEALALESRWAEIVDVTDGLRVVEESTLQVGQYRAAALERVGRVEESYRLLLQVVQVVLEEDLREPSVLFQLAESVARRGRLDVAIKLGQRANAMLGGAAGYDRIQQLQLDQRLLANAEELRTAHFLIKFPVGGQSSAEQIGVVLESERQRLLRWIPMTDQPGAPPIEVHLLWAEDFFELYDGDISFVGLFDGRIRLPLAGIDRFDNFVVGLLAHELAHALIDRATGGAAPKWFHEGVAQLIEPVGERLNPARLLQEQNVLLSFEVVEQVLQHLPNDFLVSTAYEEALWTMIYIERRLGRRAVADLIARFAAGDSTARALRAVLGQEPDQFDRSLRTWWLERAPEVWQSETVDYGRAAEDPRRLVIR